MLSLQAALAQKIKHETCRTYSLSELCIYWGLSRQAYYQSLERQRLASLQEDIILELVREQKRILPNSGGIKMLHLIKSDLNKMNIKIGRDRFFDLLRTHDLLVKRRKRVVYTTDSNHPFKVYGNLLKGLTINKILQALVADITYIRTMEGFLFLALLTDHWSRKIVGWDLSDSLELEGCLRALQMALRPMNSNYLKTHPMVHHSDRGSQYCSYLYTDLLKENHIKISMAARGNCYENALAERVNGTLKNELELHQNFKTKGLATLATKDAIYKYNYIRPHWALKLNTPASIFDSDFKELNRATRT